MGIGGLSLGLHRNTRGECWPLLSPYQSFFLASSQILLSKEDLAPHEEVGNRKVGLNSLERREFTKPSTTSAHRDNLDAKKQESGMALL